MPDTETVNVRYLVDDVAACVDFYTRHFGFTVGINELPAFADVTRGQPAAPAVRPAELGRPADGRRRATRPGGWNRIHLIVDDLDARGRPPHRGGRARSATRS